MCSQDFLDLKSKQAILNFSVELIDTWYMAHDTEDEI